MKTAKKVISVIMAVIMLITGSPILQASDMVNLDRAQIAELQKEILQDVKVDLNKSKDPVKNLIARHALVQKTPEQFAEELIINLKDIDVRAAFNEFLDLKKQAEEIAATDPRYAIIKDKNEREKVALFTTMETNLKGFVERNKEAIKSIGVLVALIASPFVIWLLSSIAAKLGLEVLAMHLKELAELLGASEVLAVGGITFAAIIALAFTLIVFLTSSYVPAISPSSSDEEAFEGFSKDPFGILAEFDEPDFYFVYNKGPKCAQLLDDVTYIEWYLESNKGNLDFESSIIPLHTQTIEWHEMTMEERADYLHNFAKLFKSQATSFRW